MDETRGEVIKLVLEVVLVFELGAKFIVERGEEFCNVALGQLNDIFDSIICGIERIEQCGEVETLTLGGALGMVHGGWGGLG